MTGTARAADLGVIDPAALKPEVLYLDLANPSAARGIAPADEKQAANLKTKEVGGQPAAETGDGHVVVKLDPAVVTEETPLLVAFSYFDADQWDEPGIQGFLHAPDRSGFYTTTATGGGADSETWRWWTTFTYANYRGYVRDGKAANFRLKAKTLRWVLALPLDPGTTAAMCEVRTRVLAMLAEYSRLLVAEAALQETRNRFEQGLKYQRPAGEVVSALASRFAEVRAGASQARVDLDRVILEVLGVADAAYLGLFDGHSEERLAAVATFQEKVRGLTEAYGALSAKAEQEMAVLVAAQRAQYRLKTVKLPLPPRLAPDRVVTAKDIQDRLFFGLVRQVPLLALPQASVDSVTQDQGIDSIYEYSLAAWVEPREHGTYDFSALDRVLGEARGLRVELGAHNIPLPAWARHKFCGDKPETLSSGRKHYDYHRVKAADGHWDGFCMPDPNGPNFNPLGAVWSETMFRYACDFFRALGKHCRGNPRILRYTLRRAAPATQEVRGQKSEVKPSRYT